MQTRKLGNVYTAKEEQSSNFGRQSGAVMMTDKRGKQVLMKKYGSGVGVTSSATSNANNNNILRMNSTTGKGNKVVTQIKMGDY